MKQHYNQYTDSDHKVWNILYSQQINQISHLASEAYLDGIKKCEFQEDRIPNFAKVNENLKDATGWKIYVVPGLIDNKPFFQHLSNKEFPATTWLRTMEQLDYLEEPDMFHDVFGHVPLLSEPFFCKYLEGLSAITLKYIDNPDVVEWMARIYWYTVEFGLIREKEGIKIYGAGILSSAGESVYSVSQVQRHRPFDLITILNTPYIKDKFQEQYFVIDSYKELFNSLPYLERVIKKSVNERKIAA